MPNYCYYSCCCSSGLSVRSKHLCVDDGWMDAGKTLPGRSKEEELQTALGGLFFF
ncbi:hypothetical protein BRADI_1g17835v3 [Brachypodium distachyon]|uniref:Uncharacterized protein n=1 Tax=Brachypodium distachyon TaxID=15368 RepID=A0A0Q3GUS6_BRADI|nr:hypothetical protein BRADI_1g17835v3 [Brachypodium distachyon]